MALAGIAASVRFAVAPPGRTFEPAPTVAPRDLAGEGYATLFARRYLEWSGAEPAQGEHALVQFEGPGIEAGAGFAPPPTGAQHVLWAEVVQARRPLPTEHVYTVAAQTDTAGLLYLAVPVLRTASGVALAGYPAFVGPPASTPPPVAPRLREVVEGPLATVAVRALRNYLAGSIGDLAADLAAGAGVSPPPLPLSLDSVQRLVWEPDGRSVSATVQAQDGRGARYTLSYELDVVRAQGRWEVQAIETDPLA
jgi:hypothetical protein